MCLPVEKTAIHYECVPRCLRTSSERDRGWRSWGAGTGSELDHRKERHGGWARQAESSKCPGLKVDPRPFEEARARGAGSGWGGPEGGLDGKG